MCYEIKAFAIYDEYTTRFLPSGMNIETTLVLREKKRPLGVHRLRKLTKRKPSHVIEFVWLAILNLAPVDQDLVVETDPVRLIPILLAKDIPETEKLYLKCIRAVLFFHFLPNRLFSCMSELDTTSPAIPSSVLIAAIDPTLREYDIPLSVMTKVRCGDPDVIYSFSAYFHGRSSGIEPELRAPQAPVLTVTPRSPSNTDTV